MACRAEKLEARGDCTEKSPSDTAPIIEGTGKSILLEDQDSLVGSIMKVGEIQSNANERPHLHRNIAFLAIFPSALCHTHKGVDFTRPPKYSGIENGVFC